MDNNEKQPFATVLAAVFDAESISVPFLFRFSDMLPDEQTEFDTRWPKLEPTRRYEIMQHLADISEDNFAVDFGPVFALGLQDEDAAVRKAALDGLWDNENVKMVRPIIRLMQTDPNLEVRATAAQSLAHYVLLGEWGRIADTIKNDIIDALLVGISITRKRFVATLRCPRSIGRGRSRRCPQSHRQCIRQRRRRLASQCAICDGNQC